METYACSFSSSVLTATISSAILFRTELIRLFLMRVSRYRRLNGPL
jgi:hypothetical protein